MAVKSVIFAHLSRIDVKDGQKIKKGDVIGIMGNTGYSFGNHLHVSVVKGRHTAPWYRSDFDSGRAIPLEKETLAFKTNDLFRYDGKLEPAYLSANADGSENGFWHKRSSGFHYALDLVTNESYRGKVPGILWNQSENGVVTAIGNDSRYTSYGYGNYVVVTYGVEETNKEPQEPTKKRYFGVDISEFQDPPAINYSTLANQIDFAIIRAGGRGRDSRKFYKDSAFEDHYENLLKRGIPMGAYFYSTAVTVAEAVEEANELLRIVKGKRFEYPLVLDIEDPKQANLTSKQKADIVMAFGGAIERAGYYFMVYSFKNWLDYAIDKEPLKKFDHWVADWREGVDRDSHAGIWQFSSKGRLQGYSGDLDLNYAYQNYPAIIKGAKLNQLDKVVAKPAEPAKPVETKPAPVVVPEFVEVRKGQTLGEIAAKFNTTWQKLAELNNLADPNVIYPGQRIYLKAQQPLFHRVVRGDTLWDIAQKYKTSVSTIVRMNKIRNPNVISIGDRFRVK